MPTPLPSNRLFIDSWLMQNYRQASAVDRQTEICATINNGSLEIYSIGTQGRLFKIFKDPTSDTGWSKIDLQFPGIATAVAVGRDSSGGQALFAGAQPAENGQLYRASNSQPVQWLSFGNPGPTWLQKIRLINGPDGDLRVTVCVQTDVKQWTIKYIPDYNSEYQELSAHSPGSGIFYLAPPEYCLGLDQTYAPGANGVSVFSIGQESPLGSNGQQYWMFSAMKWDTGGNAQASTYLGGPQSAQEFTQLAVTDDFTNPGNSVLFAIGCSDSHPYQVIFDPSDPVNNGHSELIDGQVQLQRLRVTYNRHDLLQLFGINLAGYLYEKEVELDVNQQPQWLDGVIIFDEVALNQISVVRDPGGIPQVIALSQDGRLFHIWRDPLDTDWKWEEIDVSLGDVQPCDTYETKVTVLDEMGAPKANAIVGLFSDEPLTMLANGKSVYLDAFNSWSGVTNIAGQLTITTLTDTLGATIFKLRTDFMPEGDRIEIDPAAKIKDRLYSIDAAELRRAKKVANNGTTSALLPNPQEAAALAEAAKVTMSLFARNPVPVDRIRTHNSAQNSVARYLSKNEVSNSSRLRRADVKEQYWVLDFSGETLQVEILTKKEASARMHSNLSLPRWNVQWGDVRKSIEEGFASVTSGLKQIIVATVVDPATNLVTEIKAQVSALIAGVQRLWDGVLNFVQQVFDMLETAFEKAKVFFDDLLRWLGFVFNKDDIFRTKQVVDHVCDVMLDFSAAAMDEFARLLSDGITYAWQQTSSTFAQGVQTLEQLLEEVRLPQHLRSVGENNFFLTAFMNNLGMVQTLYPPPGLAVLRQSSPMLRDWQDITESAMNSPSGQSLPQYIEHLAESGFDQFYRLDLNEIFRQCRTAAETMFSKMTPILEKTLERVRNEFKSVGQQFADWPLEFPVLTPLYQKISGSSVPLRARDVITCVLAFEATLAYKDIYEVAPFPDEDSVRQFKAEFTAPHLQAWMQGEDSKTDRVIDYAKIGRTLGIMGALQEMTLGSFFEAFLDGTTAAGAASEGKLLAVNALALANEVISFGMGVPWIDQDGLDKGLDPRSADGLAKLTYFTDLATHLGIDAFGLFFGKALPRFGSGWGMALAAAVSAVDFAWAIAVAVVNQREKDAPFDPLELASNFVATLPGFCKFLRLKNVITATKGVSLAALMVLDAGAHSFVGKVPLDKLTKHQEPALGAAAS